MLGWACICFLPCLVLSATKIIHGCCKNEVLITQNHFIGPRKLETQTHLVASYCLVLLQNQILSTRIDPGNGEFLLPNIGIFNHDHHQPERENQTYSSSCSSSSSSACLLACCTLEITKWSSEWDSYTTDDSCLLSKVPYPAFVCFVVDLETHSSFIPLFIYTWLRNNIQTSARTHNSFIHIYLYVYAHAYMT